MTVFQDTVDFSRGEIDEAMYARQSAEFYLSAAEKMENFLPDRVGGTYKRAPVEHVLPNAAIGPEAATSLIGAGIGDQVLPSPRFNKPLNGRSYTSADMMVKTITLVQQDYQLFFERLYSSNGTGDPDANALIVEIVEIQEGPAGDLILNTNKSVSKVFYFNNPVPGEVRPSGFPDHVDIGLSIAKTPSLERVIHTTFTGPAAFIATGRMPVIRVYIDDNGSLHIEEAVFYEEIIGEVSVEKGSSTVSGAASQGGISDTIFQDQMNPGQFIQLPDGNDYEIADITAQDSLTLTSSYSGLSVTDRAAVRRGLAPFGPEQFPSQVTFFQGRLVVASTYDKPTGIWASASNKPFWILAGNVTDSSPINQEAFLPGVSQFQWMTSTDRIYFGTVSSEYAVGQPTRRLTPTNFTVQRIGTTGSAGFSVLNTDTTMIHIGRGARRAFAVEYDFSTQAFASSDITFLVPHLFQSDIRAVSHRGPTRGDFTGRLFVALENGGLRACAYEPSVNLLGWSRLSLMHGLGNKVISISSTATRVFFLIRSEELGCYYFVTLARDARKYMNSDVLRLATVQRDVDTGLLYFTVDRAYWGYGVNSELTLDVYAEDFSWISSAVSYGAANRVYILRSEAEVAVGDTVYYGYPAPAELKLLPSATSTPRGSRLNLRKRLVRALIDVVDTSQVYANGLAVLPDTRATPEDGYTGVYDKRFLGWTHRDELTLSVPSQYRALIRSLTREIG